MPIGHRIRDTGYHCISTPFEHPLAPCNPSPPSTAFSTRRLCSPSCRSLSNRYALFAFPLRKAAQSGEDSYGSFLVWLVVSSPLNLYESIGMMKQTHNSCSKPPTSCFFCVLLVFFLIVVEFFFRCLMFPFFFWGGGGIQLGLHRPGVVPGDSQIHPRPGEEVHIKASSIATVIMRLGGADHINCLVVSTPTPLK